jgi:gluconolactonase
VSDYAAQLSWVFQIQPDGSLIHKQRYFYVHMPDAATRSGADGMAVDTEGRVYIATSLGVQVFDQIGKCHASRRRSERRSRTSSSAVPTATTST